MDYNPDPQLPYRRCAVKNLIYISLQGGIPKKNTISNNLTGRVLLVKYCNEYVCIHIVQNSYVYEFGSGRGIFRFFNYCLYIMQIRCTCKGKMYAITNKLEGRVLIAKVLQLYLACKQYNCLRIWHRKREIS